VNELEYVELCHLRESERKDARMSTVSAMEDIHPAPRRVVNLLPANFQLTRWRPIRNWIEGAKENSLEHLSGFQTESCLELRESTVSCICLEEEPCRDIIEIGSDDRKLTFQVIVREMGECITTRDCLYRGWVH